MNRSLELHYTLHHYHNPHTPKLMKTIVIKHQRNFSSKLGNAMHQNLPDSKELKCAVVNWVVGKIMKLPSTSRTMSQIIKWHSTFINVESNNSDLVDSVLNIQKYKTSRNILKAVECVRLLKQKYSI